MAAREAPSPQQGARPPGGGDDAGGDGGGAGSALTEQPQRCTAEGRAGGSGAALGGGEGSRCRHCGAPRRCEGP